MTNRIRYLHKTAYQFSLAVVLQIVAYNSLWQSEFMVTESCVAVDMDSIRDLGVLLAMMT